MRPVTTILDISQIDPDQSGLEHWLDASRLESAARFRLQEDRARCIGAGLLLAHAIRSVNPAYTLPPVLSAGPYGKPFLADLADFHFCLSHSGKWAVCAAASHPTGVDIEQLPSLAELTEIAPNCLTPKEQHTLFALPQIDQPSFFCKLWTLKESYMKATGLGFHLPPRELEIQFGSPLVLLHNKVPVSCELEIHSFPDPGYCLAQTQLPAISSSMSDKIQVRFLDPDTLV